jgi:peptidoglycan hydrolase-like protein with peptidoglycan-binding domain
MLTKLGYKIEKVDGKYGPKTAKAIKAFQKDHQLKVDGKVSDQLNKALKAATKDLSSNPTPPSDPKTEQTN